MYLKRINVFKIDFPVKRPFQWRVVLFLVTLYFLGNLAGVPLLRKTNVLIEPVWFWSVATLISAIIIALSLAMANRTCLGAPLLEAMLTKQAFLSWGRSGLALTLLMLVFGFPLSWMANLNVDPVTYPFGWELLAASFKAGIVEEIFGRFFLVSLFVWIGRFFKSDTEGRPRHSVYWLSILLGGLMFGWSHVDARLGHPTATFWDYTLIMVLNTALGLYFGWLFWILGLEWAMIAHFAYDSFVSMVVVPVYLLENPIAWGLLIAGLMLALVISWRMLTHVQPD